MSSTDDRIVKMQFDNDEFKKKAAETKQSLTDVNKAVDSAGKSKGLLDLNSNMQKVQVTASKMGIVVATAIGTITNKVVNAGLSMAKSLTLDPIRSGFQEYEAMLKKQVTIQNATGQSAGKVRSILNQLNTYSDKTIYSFGNMTDAITKFTNAGVPLDKAVTSIKGIANAAAFAGASSEEANRAMYAFSQSMSLGFIQLQDWNQIENANMGTVRFKNELIKAAAAVGTLKKQGDHYVDGAGKTISATKGWRDGLKDQWATTEVLNKALGKYADTNTKLGREAFDAATKVRSFSAFMDTLKESLGSGWGQVFRQLIGGVKGSTKFWTGLSQAIGGVVSSTFNWLAATLGTWRKLGGFWKTMEGFHNLLSPIAALFKAIGTAFRQAFPNSGTGAGKGLYAISAAFAAVTKPLTLLADLITSITPVLATFFRVIHIGGSLVGDAVGWIKDFVSSLLGLVDLKAPSSGGFLGFIKDIAAALGDAIKQVDDLMNKGKSLTGALSGVHFKMPKLPNFAGLGKSLSGGAAGAGGASGGFLTSILGPLGGLSGQLDKVKAGFKSMAGSVSGSVGTAQSAAGKLGEVLGKIWDVIQKVAAKVDFKDIVSSFNLAILATFMLSLSRMFNTLAKDFQGFAGIGGSIKDVLDQSKDALKAYQTQVRAKLILNIAIAIGILAASLWVLSKIPAAKLATAMAALGGVFLMLNASMKSLTKMLESFDGWKTSANLLAASVGMVAFAGAMLILAAAFLIMNHVDWQSVVKGLLTMRVLMVSITQMGMSTRGASKNLIAGAAAIAIVAGAMLVLAAALLAFKLVDWKSMGKAGVALAAVSLAVGLLALIPYEGIAKVGLALLAASAGMLAIANALIIFGAVKWSAIGKAAVMLGLLTIALIGILLVGGDATISGLVLLAAAMVGLAMAGLILNKVSWNSIAKIGAILLGLVVAVALFATILAAFLYVIAPVSPVLIVLAGAFALLGLGLLAFAAAMAVAITLGAAGVAAFAALATGAAVAVAVFMQTLASEAPILKNSILQILQAMIDTIVGAVPMIIDGIKRLWNAVKAELQGDDKKKGAGDAAKGWIDSIGDKIKAAIPVIVDKAGQLIGSFIKGLTSKAASLGGEAAKFVGRFVQGIANNLGGVIQSGANLIIAWIQGIGKQSARIADAAAKTVIQFINDMATSIRQNEPELMKAMSNLGVQMVAGLIDGIGQMFGDAMSAIGNLASGMVNKAKGILKIFSPSRVFRDIGQFLVMGLTNGIQNTAASAINAVASMVGGQIAVANEYISKFIQDLDQKAIAAQAKAEGLALAADRAQKAASKTKTKKDDKAADKLGKQADAAEKAAEAAQARSDAAKAAQDRKEQFNNASYLEKAQMRSEDAQNQLDAAKDAEKDAAKNLAAANALDAQAKKKGLTKKERADLRAQADKLRAQAKADAARANSLITTAKGSAADALKYQKLAGDEAAKAFQDQFDAEKKAADDAEAFDKMTNAEKAAQRRKDADALNAKAAQDLADAKKLAYTDLEAANALAQQAMDEADQARQYIDDAEGYEQQGGGITGVGGTVVNLTPTDMAAAGMDSGNSYDAATAAAGSGPSIEFNQYNTSPEALSPSELYRQTHNQLTFAADKLAEASAA